MSLTKLQIEHAQPREKPYKVFDGRGLYLEVTPQGGRLWRFKYRIAGKEKRISLGIYPDVTLKQARERLEAARKQVAAGIDPSEQRKAEKATSIESRGPSRRGKAACASKAAAAGAGI